MIDCIWKLADIKFHLQKWDSIKEELKILEARNYTIKIVKQKISNKWN